MNMRLDFFPIIALCATYGISMNNAMSQELKDPSARDEDISSTRIEVDYRQDGSGLWVYEYTLYAPDDNLGRIGNFSLDLRCDVDFDNSEIVPDPPYDDIGYAGRDNLEPIAPTTVSAEWGSAARFGIGQRNIAFWVTNIRPGEKAGKLTLTSIAEPGLRQYELLPHMSMSGYDYSGDLDLELLPWTDDFAVQGVIAAPGCPGEVPPVEEPRFPGTLRKVETEKLNALLSYKEPLRDRLQLPENTDHATITIVYGNELDAKSFKVEPGWAKRFFHPEPGTDETVMIPMKNNRLRLFLEGHPRKSNNLPSKGGETPAKHALKDRDEFEFRLPGFPARSKKGDDAQ